MRILLGTAMLLAVGAASSVQMTAVQTAAPSTFPLICAYEGQTCIAPNANTTIYYGKNGAYRTTFGVTQIECTNEAFRSDPLVGPQKFCYYSVDPEAYTWTRCASENQRCDFTGARLVRYGASKTTYASFVNGVDCNNKVFGDPDVGPTKSCFVGAPK